MIGHGCLDERGQTAVEYLAIAAVVALVAVALVTSPVRDALADSSPVCAALEAANILACGAGSPVAAQAPADPFGPNPSGDCPQGANPFGPSPAGPGSPVQPASAGCDQPPADPAVPAPTQPQPEPEPEPEPSQEASPPEPAPSPPLVMPPPIDPGPSPLPTGDDDALAPTAPEADRRFQPAIDYDTDGCYSQPAIFASGRTNPGLNNTGNPNGACRDAADLENSNAYSRSACDEASGWCAHMYGYYFEKDQAVPGPVDVGGHRHDFEHVIVWVKDDQVQYVSVSAHGKYSNTRPASEVEFENGHPKVVYHKEGGTTHAIRFSKTDEEPENHSGQWHYPDLVGWDDFPPGIRDTLTSADFGSASLDLEDDRFMDQLQRDAAAEGIPFNP